jgi:hypothetical protein
MRLRLKYESPTLRSLGLIPWQHPKSLRSPDVNAVTKAPRRKRGMKK